MYDLTVITDSPESEASVLKHIDNVKGSVVNKNNLGTKSLTYPIDKKTEGTYLVFIIDINPNKVMELDRELRLDTKVMRHLLLKTNSKELPKLNSETHPEETRYPRRPETKTTPSKTVEKKESVVKPESKEDATKRKKAVDEKLEEILQA